MTRALALALTVLTGFSGLVYEVSWEKYLATLLGSHSEATASVLAIFLGGLSLGYSLFGRLTRLQVARGRGGRLLVLYGCVEGGIGLYVLLFPWLFRGALALSSFLPQGATGIGFVCDVLLAALLIGPPTVLMGGTIPILTQALSRSTADATRFHALVYSLNTAGAFAGALAAGFLLIPALGLRQTMLAMGLVNLSAGLVFGLLGLRGHASAAAPAAEPAAPAVRGFGSFAAAALLVGFAMMALQTILIRIGGLSLGASQFTFSMVVAAFVLCIALGSLAVSALPRIPRFALAVNQWLLVALLFVLYWLLPDSPYGAHVLRSLFRDTDQAFYGFFVAVFLSMLLVIGPTVILSGATLPLLFHHLRREVADLGGVAGRLYSWNTLGSLLGALFGGYLLLFWLDLHHVFQIALAALIGAAVLLCARVGGIVHRVSLGLLVASLLGLALVRGWDPGDLVHGPFRLRQPTDVSYVGADAFLEPRRAHNKLLFYDDDPVSSVAVTEQVHAKGGVARSIINNGKSDGSTLADYPTMSLAAIIPALLADRVERAFVIGFGTGISVGELISLPGVEKVIVSEISPAVLEGAPLFDFANQNVSRSPKVELIRSDAYRALLRSDERFDVIVSEPSNPWVQGVEMLFAAEFLEAARERLTPGGVYAQWFHQYETSTETVSLVLRTYASVFERVSVWYGLGPDLIVLGFAEGAHPMDLERLERRAASPAFRPGLARAGVDTFEALLAHELLPLGVVEASHREGRVHSLYEPILGYVAARAFYGGRSADLPFTGFGQAAAVGWKTSLLARRMREEPLARRALFDALCANRQRECVALLALWYRKNPDAPHLRGFMARITREEGLFGGRVEMRDIVSASRLYTMPEVEKPDAPVPLGVAERASEAYARFYTHSIPFAAEALLGIWSRCRESVPSEGRCEQGATTAGRLVRQGLSGADPEAAGSVPRHGFRYDGEGRSPPAAGRRPGPG
jgi:predicted membrane-bound spermidine synthase